MTLSDKEKIIYAKGFMQCVNLYARAAGHEDGDLKEKYIMSLFIRQVLLPTTPREEIRKLIDELEASKLQIDIVKIMQNKLDADKMKETLSKDDILGIRRF